jgi:predicted ATPase
VVQIGAALGRSFSHELIAAVAAMPQVKLDDALDQLVNAELIYRGGTPPDAEYTFKHALAWCLSALGQRANGIRLALQGLDSFRATGAKLMLPFFLMTLADIYRMNAQLEEGFNRLAEAADVIETTQERWAEAEMHRLRGTLLLAMHDVAAAENSFQRALTVAQHHSAKFWELRTALDLARLWRDQGKRTEARDLLAPIYGWFTEGFDTPVLQDAKTLLDELM